MGNLFPKVILVISLFANWPFTSSWNIFAKWGWQLLERMLSTVFSIFVSLLFSRDCSPNFCSKGAAWASRFSLQMIRLAIFWITSSLFRFVFEAVAVTRLQYSKCGLTRPLCYWILDATSSSSSLIFLLDYDMSTHGWHLK